MPIPFFLLLILRRILLVAIDILRLLARLSSLSGLLTLAVLARLTALLSLSLAVLAALLLIFLHIVCHEYSSNFAERLLLRHCEFM